MSVVGVSTVILPGIHGYGTILFQYVVLGSWVIVSELSSELYADQNHWAVWIVAFVLNIFFYLVPALVVWVVARKRWPTICTWIILFWCLFYLSLLLFIFPATDGP